MITFCTTFRAIRYLSTSNDELFLGANHGLKTNTIQNTILQRRRRRQRERQRKTVGLH